MEITGKTVRVHLCGNESQVMLGRICQVSAKGKVQGIRNSELPLAFSRSAS